MEDNVGNLYGSMTPCCAAVLFFNRIIERVRIYCNIYVNRGEYRE